MGAFAKSDFGLRAGSVRAIAVPSIMERHIILIYRGLLLAGRWLIAISCRHLPSTNLEGEESLFGLLVYNN